MTSRTAAMVRLALFSFVAIAAAGFVGFATSALMK